MNQPLFLAGIAIFAVLLGLVIGWFAGRGRTAALTAHAAAEAKASVLGELATLNERSNTLSAGLATERQERLTLQQSTDSYRAQLDTASNEIARLTERSRRVPELEGQIDTLEAHLATREVELRQVSTAQGQSSERAAQLGQQLREASASLTETQLRLDNVNTTLQQANEVKAALEQQAVRVPRLEQLLAETAQSVKGAHDELAQLREATSSEISRLTAELAAEREALALARREGAAAHAAATAAETRVADMTYELTELRTRTDDEREHAAEKLQMLLQAKEALSNQFKALANEILEEKSKRFAEQNQTNLGQLLEPLRNQLTEFKGKVEEVYVQEGKDRSALSEQVRQLVSLNQTLSDDARNLTQALKGQAKTQGMWGELILERVLEASGLRKGHEYKVQDSQTREDGSRAQPDVVIELPEDRKLVVDAKVSLVEYELFVSAENEDESAIALKLHLSSVREHIKGLSDKSYHQLYGLQSLDFVLAFVPVEPAFMLAVTNDNELFIDAWQRNVLLVSPSTLLFVVRTVAHLWRQEAQSRNAQEIAKRGGQLYDKLVSFATDLQKVGERLTQAKTSYDDAHARLVTGNGNVIRQAEMLKDLGVKPTKSMPKRLLEITEGKDDIVLPASPVEAGMSAAGERNSTAQDAAPIPHD